MDLRGKTENQKIQKLFDIAKLCSKKTFIKIIVKASRDHDYCCEIRPSILK